MDGWNEDRLESVISVLSEASDALYELQNCIRGCNTGAETYEELQSYLENLGRRLMEEAEYMPTEEDEEEDEEE